MRQASANRRCGFTSKFSRVRAGAGVRSYGVPGRTAWLVLVLPLAALPAAAQEGARPETPAAAATAQASAPTAEASPPVQTPGASTPTPGATASDRKAVTNADVVQMVHGQLSDASVIAAIDLAEGHFDVSPDALIALKKEGVSDSVITAMLDSVRRQGAPAGASHATPTAAATPPVTEAPHPPGTPSAMPMSGMPPNVMAMMSDPRLQAAQARLQAMGYGAALGSPMAMMGGPVGTRTGATPHVFRVDGADRSELSASSAERAVSKMTSGMPSEGSTLLRTLAGQALRFAAIGAGPAGMAAVSGASMFSHMLPGMHASTPTITYAWGLPGLHSARTLGSSTPAFELRYADIPGIDPDAFEPAVLHLVTTRDNYRLLGATRQAAGGMNAASSTPEWIAEERVPVVLQKRERGVYAVRVTQTLALGEYAVVLRPAAHYRAQASGFANTDLLSTEVWDFSVPGSEAPPAARRN